ncbi:hypothetical protein BDV28DRAFT_128966 [Aspergillus coremiiformis]|uniref:Geranylgeranyl pyrophosphate synthetase n=1 Tax=Aspergillus coremiiformis TaxID=138285 RepID=A0A5N6ZCV8_9EURO|nr:hypothetical protein BDV28DRAFT_128966 [Aspergillus coremiiformis]
MSEPATLTEDQGEYFRDQNAARYSSYPMQPTVEAIFKLNNTFESNMVDIVACGSTMGNLLRFVRDVKIEFRIIIEAVGSTIFFLRREKSPTQTICGVRGYGHTFPEASTTWEPEVKGSESHQRILRYKFAGLTCVVRFEADGYLPQSPISQAGPAFTEDESVEEQLLAALQSSAVTSHRPDDSKRLVVQAGGQYVSQATVFDLKTRSFRRKEDDILGEQLPRLWVSQIPNFILAFHYYGLFNDVRVQDVREDVARWETKNEDSLRQFAALLQSLVGFAMGRPDGRFEVIHEEGGNVLELRELDENMNSVLPASLKDRWCMGSTDAVVPAEVVSRDDVSRLLESEEKLILDWESESEKDFTACSASCGYCGRCSY